MDRKRYIESDRGKGKTLTLTTEPFKSPFDGKEIVVVTTWERVE
jgi:hypothetical protein